MLIVGRGKPANELDKRFCTTSLANLPVTIANCSLYADPRLRCVAGKGWIVSRRRECPVLRTRFGITKRTCGAWGAKNDRNRCTNSDTDTWCVFWNASESGASLHFVFPQRVATFSRLVIRNAFTINRKSRFMNNFPFSRVEKSWNLSIQEMWKLKKLQRGKKELFSCLGELVK